MGTTRSAPPFTTPMQPTLVSRPFQVDGFVYEEKIDGFRMVAYKLDGTVKLISRQGADHTARFRDVAAGVAASPTRTSSWTARGRCSMSN